MKIHPSNNSPNFKNLYKNKALLNSLEFISDHGATFCAGVSFVSALCLRPLAISVTPKTDKENKKIISAESVSSAITKLAITEAVALPIEKAIKNINNTPKKFLKENTQKNLSKKDYDFLTQFIKLSSNFISAIPKSVLSVALIPIVSDLFFTNKNKNKNKKPDTLLNKDIINKYPAFISFKGIKNLPNEIIAKVINSENMQKFAKKHSYNDKNIAKNMSVLTDILLTTSSAIGTIKSKKINKEQKKPLILNKTISTAISILLGCKIDELVQKGTSNFIQKFSEINKNDPKLSKYISGINIARPTIVFALIYYGLIPILSTFCADKLSKQESRLKK